MNSDMLGGAIFTIIGVMMVLLVWNISQGKFENDIISDFSNFGRTELSGKVYKCERIYD